MQLASIHSSEDHDLLNELINESYFWIGLSDAEQEGVWKWTDGQNLGYTNWKEFPEPEVETREFYYRSNSVKWQDARNACLSEGMDLASIHSQEEQDRVEAVSERKNTWIGMVGAIGQTHWVDGTPIDYTNWQSAQPDQLYACVHLWKVANLKWDDWTCTFKHPYICSKLVTHQRDCVIVDQFGKWYDTDCEQRYSFACTDRFTCAR